MYLLLLFLAVPILGLPESHPCEEPDNPQNFNQCDPQTSTDQIVGSLEHDTGQSADLGHTEQGYALENDTGHVDYLEDDADQDGPTEHLGNDTELVEVEISSSTSFTVDDCVAVDGSKCSFPFKGEDNLWFNFCRKVSATSNRFCLTENQTFLQCSAACDKSV